MSTYKMDDCEILHKIVNDWKVFTAPTCNCKRYRDVRSRCQPQDATFKACKARVDTAMWYIENCGKSLEDFLFLGPKIQYLIKSLMEEEYNENNQ